MTITRTEMAITQISGQAPSSSWTARKTIIAVGEIHRIDVMGSIYFATFSQPAIPTGHEIHPKMHEPMHGGSPRKHDSAHFNSSGKPLVDYSWSDLMARQQ